MILLSHSFSVGDNSIGDKGATALSGALMHCNQIRRLKLVACSYIRTYMHNRCIANAMGAYFLLPTIIHVHVYGCMHACKRKGFFII